MLIGVDARIPTRNKTGIAYMIDGIVSRLIEKDKANYYKVLGYAPHVSSRNFRAYKFPKLIQRGLNFWWKTFNFPPLNMIAGRFDRFLFLNFADFPVFAKKKVLLIPDTSFIKHPEFTEKKNLKFLQRGVVKAILRSDMLITISENAKKEICEYYGIDENLVRVVYPGCPDGVARVDDPDTIELAKKKYGIEGKYVLFMGTLEPRKNLKKLIESYGMLNDELKKEYRLALCGGKGWYYDEVFDTVKELGLGERVVFTGYVDGGDRSALYSGASLFVLPSFYEGFGLPILEAFSCGVPVVCSDISSLPEVGGEAATYCDPESSTSMKEAMQKVLYDDVLKKDMIEKGFLRLKKFSWDDAVKKVCNIVND